MAARGIDALLVFVFVGGITLPFLDGLLRPAEARTAVTVEYREPAPRPVFEWTAEALRAYPEGFEAWYADSFGLRDKLIRWHNSARWFGLRASPTSEVLRGKDDWIFTTWGGAIECGLGLSPMTEAELERWRLTLELRRAWLAKRGIRFLYAVVPDKLAVYPERLPERVRVTGTSRREQFLQHMAEHSDVEVLDLLPALVAEKARDVAGDGTYYRLGDHWTDRGALAGYGVIARALGFEPLVLDDFLVRPGLDQGDNWGERMYLGDVLRQETRVLIAKERRIARPPGAGSARRVRWVHDDETLPRAVFVHDSFGVLPVEHLATHFSETLALWQPHIDLGLVAREKPDVVVQLYVDRSLEKHRPRIEGEEGRALLQRWFEGSHDVLARHAPPALSPYGGAGISADGDATLVEIHGAGDLVHLPELPFAEGGATILSLELECERETELRLYYRTRSDPEVSRSRYLRGRAVAGQSRVYFELAEPGLAGTLLLGLDRHPQHIRVRSIEARAIGRGGELERNQAGN